MSIHQIILGIYGILLAAGGFMGAKAGSKVSLIMGLLSGALVLIGVYLTQTNTRLGYGLIVGTSAFLTLTFLMRLIKTSKFMPSGMLMILSAAALIVSLSRIVQK